MAQKAGAERKKATKKAVEVAAGTKKARVGGAKNVAQPREFVATRAGSVLQKWYSLESEGRTRAPEALSGELRLADRVAEGFPTKAVDEVIESGLVEAGVVYDIVVPRRTLADRKQKEKPLSPEQSDRLARILRVYARAEDAIGDVSRAFRWLHKENRALAGKRPIELLGSDAGTRAVEKVLGRIEHGIVS